MQQAGISPGSLCQLHLRLRGGGGDGGATGAESRISYLEMYMGKKVDKVSHIFATDAHPMAGAELLPVSQINPADERHARFTHCSLSGEPLSPPCCADELGNLYNKDAVVTALLKKVSRPAAL